MSERTEVATRMAEAANLWLADLDDEQRARRVGLPGRRRAPAVVLHTDRPRRPDDRRDAPRPAAGGDAAAAQRPVRAPAYVTASTVMGLENVLDEVERFRQSFGRERGRDPGMYYVRVFGEPGAGATWGWRFGGHHVSVNHTIVDGELAASTPCFLGADPASSPLLGPHLLRPLAGAEDLGRELVTSLDDGQLDRALLAPVAPVDLVTANRSRVVARRSPTAAAGHLPRPPRHRRGDRMAAGQAAMEAAVGLTPGHLDALALSAEAEGPAAPPTSGPAQRDLLRALLDVYVRRVPDELADAESARYAADDALDELAFGWAGGLLPGEPHYYRVQGRGLLAEYDNTQRGVNHVHTVWRHLDADFGGDVLAAPLRPRPLTCVTSTGPSGSDACWRATTSRRPRRPSSRSPVTSSGCTPPIRRPSSCRSAPASNRSRSPTWRMRCTSDRTLLRMLAMRRTMFVAPLDLAAVMDAACTRALVPGERRKLVALLEAAAVTDDAEAWIDRVGAETLAALHAGGPQPASQLTKVVPDLARQLTMATGTAYEGTIGVSTRILFLLATRG